MHLEGNDVSHMVVYDTEVIYWDKEKIIQREDGSVVAFIDNIRLPCLMEDNGCTTSQGTYVWNLGHKPHCPLYNVQKFRGHITFMPSKKEKVIMSVDGSLVRYVLGVPKVECGHLL